MGSFGKLQGLATSGRESVQFAMDHPWRIQVSTHELIIPPISGSVNSDCQ